MRVIMLIRIQDCCFLTKLSILLILPYSWSGVSIFIYARYDLHWITYVNICLLTISYLFLYLDQICNSFFHNFSSTVDIKADHETNWIQLFCALQEYITLSIPFSFKSFISCNFQTEFEFADFCKISVVKIWFVLYFVKSLFTKYWMASNISGIYEINKSTHLSFSAY